MGDLKVLVNESDFYFCQTCCITNNIPWDQSGLVYKKYKPEYICLYFRAKSKTLQYGIRKYNFNEDVAKAVTISEFANALNSL